MNRRVYFACRQAGFAKDGTATFVEIHGLQSIGMTTNFNLEAAFEQGQLAVFQQVEGVPEIEITLEKVLDGYPLLLHLATNGSTSPTLVGRSNITSIFGMSVFSDTSSSASGTPIAEVTCSGMAPSAVTYTIPNQGNCTEALTLVGNNKLWRDDETLGNGIFTGRFNNNDQPLALTGGSGGIQQRQNVVMIPIASGVGGAPAPGTDINGANTGWVSTWPTDIPGIAADGTNPVQADGTFLAPIQSATVSCDLGRTSIFELGRKAAYWKFIGFPVEVRTEIEVLSRKWDNKDATEAGGTNGAPAGFNTKNQTIKVRLQDGTYIQCGTNNRLTTVAATGGDAGTGGGNVMNRYSYTTWDDLTVQHPQDPSGV